MILKSDSLPNQINFGVPSTSFNYLSISTSLSNDLISSLSSFSNFNAHSVLVYLSKAKKTTPNAPDDILLFVTNLFINTFD